MAAEADRKILVIEDTRLTREALMDFLAEEGYQVIPAADGRYGLQQAREHRPDLILCDCRMPVMDGVATLRALRSDPEISATPFIFVTGQADGRLQRTAADLGVSGCLEKPFRIDQLLQLVGNAFA